MFYLSLISFASNYYLINVIYDENKNTYAMLQAMKGYIPDDVYQHDPSLQNDKGYTVAMYLAKNKLEVPKQWLHDPLIKNVAEFTVALIYAQNGMIPPKEWEHHKLVRVKQICHKNETENGKYKYYTVQNFLNDLGIDVPRQWSYKLQNEQEDTQAMIQARKGYIPMKQYLHNPYIQNINGETVAFLLARNGQIPPKEWKIKNWIQYEIFIQEYLPQNNRLRNNVDYCTIYNILDANQVPISHHWNKNGIQTNLNKEQYKVFDQACYGQIPKLENNKPEMQNDKGWTVAMILAYNNIDIPKEWYHDPNIQNSYGQTVAMIMFDRCKDIKKLQIPQQWLHNPELQNKQNTKQYKQTRYNFTMAMRYAYIGIIPPKQWNHKSDLYGQIQDLYHYSDNSCTVAMLLASNGIIPPKCWVHNTAYTETQSGKTVAMLLLQKGIDPPEEWWHEPQLCDKDGYTVALMQAEYGIIPSKQWCHDRFIRTKKYRYNNYTVQNILKKNGMEVPDEWKYDNVVDDRDNTRAMKYAKREQIPDQKYYHTPQQTNIYGETVAMLLVERHIWPPREWEHDKFMQNNDGETVAELIAGNHIYPPKQWMITKNENQKIYENIRAYLGYNKNYDYINGKFVFSVKTIKSNDMCQICFIEEEQDFVKTKCGHKVCYQCLLEFIRIKQFELCPICRQKDWYENLSEDELRIRYSNNNLVEK